MIIRKEIDLNEPLTEAQKQMLNAMQSRPVQPDEDVDDGDTEETSFVEVPDSDVPLGSFIEIEESDVPLGDFIDIDDPDVPLTDSAVDNPKTGEDRSFFNFAALSAMASAAVLVFAARRKYDGSKYES